MKYVIRLIILASLLLNGLNASADRGGFYYQDFRYQAVVHKNNVWDVTETITVNFSEPRHGIYRYIPQEFYTRRASEPDSTIRFRYSTDVYAVSVQNQEFTTEVIDDNKVIRIGSEDTEVTGQQTYVIRYQLQYPDDRLADQDQLFHTVLGADFEEPIQHFSFQILFEKNLPAEALSKLQVFSGAFGAQQAFDPHIQASAKQISGEAHDIAPHHALTLFMQLPEGYYEGVSTVSAKPARISLYLALACLLMSIIVACFIHGPSVTKQIEFYPPEGISSAEVGTIIDTTVDNVDLASLIPWMAHQGYITITEKKAASQGKKSSITLRRVRVLPANAPRYQKDFMQALFGKNTQVCLDKMPEHPTEMSNAYKHLNEVFSGERSLTEFSSWCWLLPLGILFGMVALGLASAVNRVDFSSWIFAIFCYLGVTFFMLIINLWMGGRSYFMSTWKRVLAWTFELGIFFGNYVIWSILMEGEDDFLGDKLASLLFMLTYLAAIAFPQYELDTPYRARVIGKLMGLKEFIETADKPRLESLQADDPKYFYRILPYAMVFGLADKWASQFKDILVQRPDWYAGDMTAFSTTQFCSSISSATSNAITVVSHDSSAVTTSGGFAGGGGGGGGGGSW